MAQRKGKDIMRPKAKQYDMARMVHVQDKNGVKDVDLRHVPDGSRVKAYKEYLSSQVRSWDIIDGYRVWITKKKKKDWTVVTTTIIMDRNGI